MIEKKIHYIWFGDEKPEKVKRCIESWNKNLKEYKIIEWNESNLDIEELKKENKFFKLCYEKKLWGVMTDYIRTKILYNEGGIYLDADVEVLKPFDELLDSDLFLGKEDEENICYAVIGCTKNHKFLKHMLDFYKDEVWKTPYFISTNIIEYVFKKYYTEERIREEKIKLYEKEYFYPYHWSEKFTNECIKPETLCIHRWEGSWTKNPNRVYLEYKHLNPILRFFKQNKKLLKLNIYRKIKK